MPQNFYELIWIFIVYAFMGWCAEVAYAALNTGKFVNRGFLNGPYCPIYGCGVVIVVRALTPLKDNLFLLFTGSFFLTSLLEFLTGFILEQAFHNKWWDYTDKPFNIKGYVCLKFSIYWGLACTFIMDILHPMIYKTITMIPRTLGTILVDVFFGIFIADLCITVSTILKFNKRLKMMDEIAAQIHRISDEIGENIYENVAEAMERSENFQKEHAELIEKVTLTAEEAKARVSESTEEAKERMSESAEAARKKINESVEQKKAKWNEKTEEARRNYEEKKKRREALNEQYRQLLESKNNGFVRLLKAFPQMKSKNNNEILEKLKDYLTK